MKSSEKCEKYWPIDLPKLLKDRIDPLIKGIRLSKEVKRAKTIFSVGGGEIGTEIGIAACTATEKRKQWFVRAAVSNKETEPISNLPLYLGRVENLERAATYYDTGKELNLKSAFRCVRLKKPFEVEKLAEKIVGYSTDIVLLEDAFLTSDGWKILQQEVIKLSTERKPPIFIPAPDQTIKHIDICLSDVFLSKIAMKKFLGSIEEVENLLLGTQEDYVEIDNLRDELTQDIIGKERKKIESFFNKSKGPIIFKLDQTTSGHGQFILRNKDDLTIKFLDRHIGYQIVSNRALNRYYVMEKYVENKIEACVIQGQTIDGKQTLSRIYYKKYGEDTSKDEKLQGIARLAWSFTENGQEKLWKYLEFLSKKINEKLRSPFLYVEFILDLGSINPDKPDVYVNEISYRPDDAGFITLLSHNVDQFSLFMDSIEFLINGGKVLKKKRIKPEAKTFYVCESLLPGQRIRFPVLLKNIKYDFPPSDTPINHRLKIRFYKKTLGKGAKAGGKITYGRIIGFSMHLGDEEGQKALRTFQEHKKIPEATIGRLIDALPGTGIDLTRGVTFAKEKGSNDYF